MSLRWYWGPPGGGVEEIDTAILAGSVQGQEQSGDLGNAGMSSIVFDNPGGTLAISGLRPFKMVEDTAPADNQVIWYGFIGDREYARDPERGMLTGADSVITAELVDQNGVLAWPILTQASANRKAETAATRLTWLLAQSNCYVNDYGKVHAPTLSMDATDYRGQTPMDVLSDIAIQSGYAYSSYYDETEGAYGLWLDDPDSANDVSVLRISNVLGDADNAITFAPTKDAKLKRSPSRVAGGVYLPYAKGAVYRKNLAARVEFGLIDRAAPMSSVKTKAKAIAAADRFLAQSDEEDDVITVTVRQPAATVNLARPLQRIWVKFSHLPGYDDDFTPVRIVSRSVAQSDDDRTSYEITYTLSPVAAVVEPARLVQHVAWNGYPAGLSYITLDSPPAEGDLLIMVSAKDGDGVPTAPTDYAWTTIDTGTTVGTPLQANHVSLRIMYRIAEAGEGAHHLLQDSGTVRVGMLAEFSGVTTLDQVDSLGGDTAGGLLFRDVASVIKNLTPTAGENALLLMLLATSNHNVPMDYGMATGVPQGMIDSGQYGDGTSIDLVDLGDIAQATGPNIGLSYTAVPDTTGTYALGMHYNVGYGGGYESFQYWLLMSFIP